MHAVSGYVDDSKIVINENIGQFNGHDVVITILDTVRENHAVSNTTLEHKKSVARELAGLWKDHDNTMMVDETVREMRRGRSLAV